MHHYASLAFVMGDPNRLICGYTVNPVTMDPHYMSETSTSLDLGVPREADRLYHQSLNDPLDPGCVNACFFQLHIIESSSLSWAGHVVGTKPDVPVVPVVNVAKA